MIDCVDELLTGATDQSLRAWMDKGEAQTLRRIVKAKVQRAQCAGLNDAMKVEKFDGMAISVSENMRIAQRYQTFLDVLEELSTQKEPFSIVRLS